ncbi:MAG TPA: hypothetical protein VGM11_10520 [Acidobacteriaceae bacterium]|jgi:hypothetical protein
MFAVWRIIVLIGMCAVAGRFWGQDQPAGSRKTEPTGIRRPGCPASLTDQLDRGPGTPLYLSLHREVAALRLGHEASQKLQSALDVHGAASGTQHQVIRVMTGMDQARDTYLCGAFVARGCGGNAALDAIIRGRIAPVLERMAAEVSRLENSVLTRSAGGRPDAAADSPREILEERRKAGAELMDAMTKNEVAMMSEESRGLTCAERNRLLTELTGVRSGAADEFTAAAALMMQTLRGTMACAG